jgi:uncharacterized protein (TIGR01777 family)
MENKKIIIAGGTGFIGQALAAYFGKTNRVIILSRQIGQHKRNGKKLLMASDGFAIGYRPWDGLRVETAWASELEGADLVINLAGKSVNCRYNAKNKKEILDSRIDATRAIGQAIREATVPPKVWINAASATIYRHAEDRPQDELNGEFQQDFSVQVCKLWEKTFAEQRAPFTRKVVLRMAITLGYGGVMTPLLTLLKFGLGGKQGNGKQMFSWIHIEDLCRAMEWLSDNQDAEGVYNVCSPFPLSNEAVLTILRQTTGHRVGLPAPGWLLEMGAALIGTETELILKSRWVLPSRLLKEGFPFHYGKMEDALKEIVGKIPRKKYHLF